MKTAIKLQWSRPFREQSSLGLRRHYRSKCGQYRVTVRIEGPGCWPPKYYAERLADLDGDRWVWSIISTHRTKDAAVSACEREARRTAKCT